ncbi:glycosyltransferase family 4 protein [Methylobacterium nodulans]|uniref:Glycosyl transferase group 1 n=1 Tax=Methylobacterium nodulans (strain LMG 21967 / CNCM I-2342 / ORS 2060) TaxID=460265 RepID=B8IQD7_METNO|nr:glycosyltransferase family 4 protein [Methylobacterium nodulans]ACL60449.1 glycosyl transferase group 1 [Methylobacterium nodulans ORS 2060]
MIRVLSAIVVPPHLSVSGGARAGETLSAALAGACSVTVASMMGGADAPQGCRRLPVRTGLPPGLPWSRLANRHRTPFYRSDIPQAIRPGAYDLVHLHNPMPALEMRRIARACRAAGIPYVVSTHGFNEIANGATIYGFGALQRAAWRHLVQSPVADTVRGADAILALSPADFDIIRRMGFAGETIDLVPNGVRLPPLGDPEEDRAIWERFGLGLPEPDAPLTCMFLANHTPNKGLPVLLRSVLGLTQPFTLVVGGETRPEVDYAGALAAAGPQQRIIVTGRLSDAEVGALLRRCDLFVFPTLADTLPLVVFEAMAHGRPVLASAVGGIPHQIDAACGRLVPAGDAEALRASLAELDADRDRLRRMGECARLRVAGGFTWEAAAEKALRAYLRVLAAREAQGTARRASPLPPEPSRVAAGGRDPWRIPG